MSHWQVSPKVLSASVLEQAVLLNPEAGEYFGLNPITSLIWEELQTPASLEHLIKVVCKTYLVTEDEALEDIEELLNEMQAKGLVMQHD
jgi:hypothetical protein